MPRKPPTYDTIIRLARVDNISISTCEFAHAKEMLGFPVKIAHNRIDPQIRTKPCSQEKLKVIRRIIKELSA